MTMYLSNHIELYTKKGKRSEFLNYCMYITPNKNDF